MRIPIPQIEPVAIALDELEASDQVRFSGIDLESGSRVTVTITREPQTGGPPAPPHRTSELVLILTMQKLGAANGG